MAKESLVANVDWPAIIYGFCMATIVSLLVTLRARNTERALGKPLTPWHFMIPDTLLGGIVGGLSSLAGPEFVPVLRNAAGVFLCAGLGGALGWRVTDWWQGNGLGVVIEWIGNGAGAVSKALKTQAEKTREPGGDADDGKDGQASK